MYFQFTWKKAIKSTEIISIWKQINKKLQFYQHSALSPGNNRKMDPNIQIFPDLSRNFQNRQNWPLSPLIFKLLLILVMCRHFLPIHSYLLQFSSFPKITETTQVKCDIVFVHHSEKEPQAKKRRGLKHTT